MVKFRHYDNSGSLGNVYGLGINFYKDSLSKRPSLDIIVGRHVFVWFIDRNK